MARAGFPNAAAALDRYDEIAARYHKAADRATARRRDRLLLEALEWQLDEAAHACSEAFFVDTFQVNCYANCMLVKPERDFAWVRRNDVNYRSWLRQVAHGH